MWVLMVPSLTEPVGDFGIGQPVGDEGEDFSFAGCKAGGQRRRGCLGRRRRGGDGVEEVVLDSRVDHGVVVENLQEGLADLGSAGVFGEVTAGTGPQRIDHRLIVGKHFPVQAPTDKGSLVVPGGGERGPS